MKGSVWGKENPVPGQEAGLCFTLKNVISLPSISPCVPLSWGHPIYDHPIGSSRQPRQRVGALSVPQSPALHIQPPNPHTVLLEPFLTMSLIHRKAQDILSVSSHQPPSWSSSPGSTPYSSSFLSPPPKDSSYNRIRSEPALLKTLPTVSTFETKSRRII